MLPPRILARPGTKLRLSEEAMAAAAVFYHTFNSVMENGQYEDEVGVM